MSKMNFFAFAGIASFAAAIVAFSPTAPQTHAAQVANDLNFSVATSVRNMDINTNPSAAQTVAVAVAFAATPAVHVAAHNVAHMAGRTVGRGGSRRVEDSAPVETSEATFNY